MRRSKAKGDSEMKATSAIAVHRYQMDIADLCIPMLPSLSSPASSAGAAVPHAVLIAKHLCGAALDLSIRAVLHSVSLSASAGVVSGLCIASCCHHRCSVSSYCNPAFLSLHHISTAEFALLCRLSSWACNDQHSAGRRRRARREAHSEREVRDDGVDWGNVLHLSWEEKVRIGREAKLLLDYRTC